MIAEVPPVALDRLRFGNFNSTVSRNCAALGNLVSVEPKHANNLDRIETIRADGRIDGGAHAGLRGQRDEP